MTIGLRVIQLGKDLPPVEVTSHFEQSQAAIQRQQMQSIRQKVNQNLRQLPAEFDLISFALHGLQQQIDLLANANFREKEQYHKIKVTLSEGGIGWLQKEPIHKNQFLALKLELDEFTDYCVYGKVVSCRPEGSAYHIGIEFQDIDQEVQQEISKFVLRADAELRRLRSIKQ